jgi:hypothetical protein
MGDFMVLLTLGILAVSLRPLTPEEKPIAFAGLAIVLAVLLVWSYLKRP